MADAPHDGADPGPGLLAALRSYPVRVLVVVVIGALLGAAFTYLRDTGYTARAQLIVGRDADVALFSDGGPSQPSARGLAATVAMRTPEVAAKASSLLDGRVSARKVERAVTVAPTSNSAVVTISARSDRAKQAADIANALARAYTAQSSEQAEQSGARVQSVLSRQETRLQTQVDAVKKQQAARTAVVAKRYADMEASEGARLTQLALSTDPDYQSLANRQSELSDTLTTLNQRQNQNSIDTQLVRSGVSTFYPADVPGGDRRQTLVRNVLIGAVLGLLLGAVLAWRRLDRVGSRPTRRGRRQAEPDEPTVAS